MAEPGTLTKPLPRLEWSAASTMRCPAPRSPLGSAGHGDGIFVACQIADALFHGGQDPNQRIIAARRQLHGRTSPWLHLRLPSRVPRVPFCPQQISPTERPHDDQSSVRVRSVVKSHEPVGGALTTLGPRLDNGGCTGATPEKASPNVQAGGRMMWVALGFLMGPLLSSSPSGVADVEEIIFAARQPGAGSHWYENFGYYAQDEQAKAYRAMGRLCRLNLRTGELTVLLDDAARLGPRSPGRTTTARKILFSYRPGGSDYFHLYEIGVDGRGLAATHRPVRTTTSSPPTCPTAGSCSAPAAAIAGSTAGSPRWPCCTPATPTGKTSTRSRPTSSTTTRPGRWPTGG